MQETPHASRSVMKYFLEIFNAVTYNKGTKYTWREKISDFKIITRYLENSTRPQALKICE